MPYRYLGEYLDENGDAIIGATVIANRRSDGDVLGIDETDSAGEFEIASMVDPELAYVTVLQDGFIPQIFDSVTAVYYEVVLPASVLDVVWNGTEFDFSWTASVSPYVTEYLLYKSVDSAPYTLLDTVSAAGPLEYTDGDVIRTSHSYDYKVVASDGLGSTSPDSNIESFPMYSAVAFALGNGTVIGRSTDFVSWSPISTPASSSKQMSGIAFSQTQNRVIICCLGASAGSRMMYSDDSGLTFSDISGLPVLAWRDIARSDTLDLWVAISLDSAGVTQIWSSQDGLTNWVLSNTGYATDVTPDTILWVEEFGASGLFVIAGIPDSIFNDNTMHSSDTGLTWTTRTANEGGWGSTEKLAKVGSTVYAYGSSSQTILKTVNGTTWAGGNQIFTVQALSGLDNESRVFACRAGPNAVTETSGGDPTVSASWNAFVDLGAAYLDVWAPPEFANYVICGRTSGYRLSTDGGLTFASEVAWSGAVGGFVKIRSALLTVS